MPSRIDPAPLFAVERKSGSLLLNVENLEPCQEPENVLDLGMNMLSGVQGLPGCVRVCQRVAL